jgi:hypothetical protein
MSPTGSLELKLHNYGAVAHDMAIQNQQTYLDDSFDGQNNGQMQANLIYEASHD